MLGQRLRRPVCAGALSVGCDPKFALEQKTALLSRPVRLSVGGELELRLDQAARFLEEPLQLLGRHAKQRGLAAGLADGALGATRPEEAPHTGGGLAQATGIHPFQIHVPKEQLAALRHRVAATRWLAKELVTDRSQGVQLARARFWTTKYDWRTVEARLNALPQFTTQIDGRWCLTGERCITRDFRQRAPN